LRQLPVGSEATFSHLQRQLRVGHLGELGRLLRFHLLGKLLRRRHLSDLVVQLRRWRARASLDFVLVALVALTVRLAHAWFVSRTPFFDGPVIDSETYRAFARHIAQTGDFGGAFYQPPLYPTFLALLFRLGLGSAWLVALVQIALGTATSVLLVTIGRRLAQDRARSRAVGLICGLAAALYGPLVLFDVELLPPCCVNLLLVGSWALALRSGKPSSADALFGLLLGLASRGP
jgi:4-amino-4-deoxy-L-arabinose transferase-like glycosyltransferase